MRLSPGFRVMLHGLDLFFCVACWVTVAIIVALIGWVGWELATYTE